MQAQFLTEKFSNGQLEVLKIFADELSEAELKILKKVLLQFRAELLMAKADAIWDEKSWTQADVRRILQTKMRSSRTVVA